MSENQTSTRPFLIGICGGSASGKTTAANFITKFLGEENCLLFSLDNYFYGPNDEERKHIEDYNFDRPEALDLNLAYEHLTQLINNKDIEMPVYSFNVSKRMPYTQKVSPKKVIIFEGIFALYEKRMRDIMDLKLFYDLDSDIRLFRRISRDISERSRVLDTVLDRYLTFVKPAFDYYIKPTRKYADIVIPQGTYNSLPIEIISQYLNNFLNINYQIEENNPEEIRRLSTKECKILNFFVDPKYTNLIMTKEENDITKFSKIIHYLMKRQKNSYYPIYISEIVKHLLKMEKQHTKAEGDKNNTNNNDIASIYIDETKLKTEIESIKIKINEYKGKKIVINIFAPISLIVRDKFKEDYINFLKEIKGEDNIEISFQIISVYLSQKCYEELNKISNENIPNGKGVNFITTYFGDDLLKNQLILENAGFVASKPVDLGSIVHFLSAENFIAEFQKKTNS